MTLEQWRKTSAKELIEIYTTKNLWGDATAGLIVADKYWKEKTGHKIQTYEEYYEALNWVSNQIGIPIAEEYYKKQAKKGGKQ